MIILLILLLFIGASATGCTDSDGVGPDSGVSVETAEITAITFLMLFQEDWMIRFDDWMTKIMTNN